VEDGAVPAVTQTTVVAVEHAALHLVDLAVTHVVLVAILAVILLAAVKQVHADIHSLPIVQPVLISLVLMQVLIHGLIARILM